MIASTLAFYASKPFMENILIHLRNGNISTVPSHRLPTSKTTTHHKKHQRWINFPHLPVLHDRISTRLVLTQGPRLSGNDKYTRCDTSQLASSPAFLSSIPWITCPFVGPNQLVSVRAAPQSNTSPYRHQETRATRRLLSSS